MQVLLFSSQSTHPSLCFQTAHCGGGCHVPIIPSRLCLQRWAPPRAETSLVPFCFNTVVLLH